MYIYTYVCTHVHLYICIHNHLSLCKHIPHGIACAAAIIVLKKHIHIKPYLLLYSACNLKGAFGPCQWQICGSWSGAWEAVGVLPPGDHFAEKEVYTVDTCIYMYHKHTRTHTDTHAASIFNFAHTHTYIYIYMHSNRYHNFNHGWYVLPCACWTGRKTFYRFDLRPGSHNDHEGWRDCLTKLCSKYLGPESPATERGAEGHTMPWLKSLVYPLPWHILTHLDASWQILTHLDTPWRILTDLDASGQILTDLARPWQVLTDLDRSWHILTDFGTSWQGVTHLNRSCHILTEHDTSGHILTHLEAQTASNNRDALVWQAFFLAQDSEKLPLPTEVQLAALQVRVEARLGFR